MTMQLNLMVHSKINLTPVSGYLETVRCVLIKSSRVKDSSAIGLYNDSSTDAQFLPTWLNLMVQF